MKYKNEIESIFRELFYEDWMDEEDFQELISEMFKETNMSYEILSIQIDVGINNGYSLEFQIDMLKNIFSQMKEREV